MMIVGIDVSKDKLDIKILPAGVGAQTPNTRSNILSIFKKKRLKLGTPELVVFESTGGYEKILMKCLVDLNLPFHRAHPKRVYHFAKGKGYFAKTDTIDAEILARYGQQDEIRGETLASLDNVCNQELSARKQQLKAMLQQEKNRRHHFYMNKQIYRSIQRHIKGLEKELDLLNNQLEESLRNNKTDMKRWELLQTIPGVGKEIALLMVTDMPELGQLSREQVSHLAGVAPQTKNSGKKEGYRTISKGRSQVRKALYMAALVAMRYHPTLKKMYGRLTLKGKKPKVALVALMRKLIIMMNAMVRDNQPWSLQSDLT
jgi:transposase